MRVGLISPLYESVPPLLYGGTERVVHNLCRGLSAAGVDVTLFASGDSRSVGRLVSGVAQSLRLAYPESPNLVMDTLPQNMSYLGQVAALSDDFDILHNHHDYWMLPLARMSRTPLITTLHGQLRMPWLREAYSSFPEAGFISISESQRSALPDLDWRRTIYHGIELADFQFHPMPGQYLAFLGRMSAEKRPDWAIEIALRAGVPIKLAAKIEGKRDREFFEERVKPKIDGRNVEYVGEISEAEKSKFLGEALGLVFPIDWDEPFGLVMIEALACGTPVLARPFGSVPEVMRPGVTGFVSERIDDLVRAVQLLPQLNRAHCRRYVADNFSLQKMIEEYLDVYRSTISRGARSHRRDSQTLLQG